MKYYIDFDNTLFNTSLFYDDLIKILKNNNVDITKINYSNKDLLGKVFGKKIDISCLIEEENTKLAKELDDFTKTIPNYLYDDAIKFLEYLNKNNKEVYLLSYGNINYQEYKIHNANINKYFKDIIIIDTPKYKMPLDFKNIIFIDDNIDDLLWFKKLGSKVIRIRRPNLKRSIIDLDEIIEYKDFNELIKLDNL